MVLGWNNQYYLFSKLFSQIESFRETKSERNSFNEIVKNIPKDASVTTSANYATHLTARNQITNWPKSILVSNDKEGNVNPEDYKYWLLPKQPTGQNKALYEEKIKEFKSKNTKIVSENEYQILFEK